MYNPESRSQTNRVYNFSSFTIFLSRWQCNAVHLAWLDCCSTDLGDLSPSCLCLNLLYSWHWCASSPDLLLHSLALLCTNTKASPSRQRVILEPKMVINSQELNNWNILISGGSLTRSKPTSSVNSVAWGGTACRVRLVKLIRAIIWKITMVH